MGWYWYKPLTNYQPKLCAYGTMYVPSQSIDTMNVAEDATNATFISSKNLLFMLGSVYFVYHR